MPSEIKMDQIVALAEEAGSLIMRLRPEIIPKAPGEQPNYIIKPDGSPVTKADTESNALCMQRLAELTPNIPIVAEENDKDQNERIMKEAPRFWTVDPLDITLNYAMGGDAFSVNIALVENGMPTHGVIFFPAMEDLFFTGQDGKAYRRRWGNPPYPIAMLALDPKKGLRADADHPLTVAIKDRIKQVAPGDKVSDNIKSVPSAGQHRACLVAAGEAMLCAERDGYRIWDTAPTHAIVLAAGGEIRSTRGAPVRYNENLILPPYFVGHASLLDRMLPGNMLKKPKTDTSS